MDSESTQLTKNKFFSALILLIGFLIFFSSLMNLIDLKNFEVKINYTNNDIEKYMINNDNGTNSLRIEVKTDVGVEYIPWSAKILSQTRYTVKSVEIETKIYDSKKNTQIAVINNGNFNEIFEYDPEQLADIKVERTIIKYKINYPIWRIFYDSFICVSYLGVGIIFIISLFVNKNLRKPKKTK